MAFVAIDLSYPIQKTFKNITGKQDIKKNSVMGLTLEKDLCAWVKWPLNDIEMHAI